VFADRLFDRLRSVAGASYSPTAQSQWPVGQPGGGRLIAIGKVAPDKVPLFFQLSRQIAAELVSTPVAEDELRRTIVPMLQYMARASSGNQFWLLQTTGGTFDPKRIEASQTLVSDFTTITPASLQAAAAKYLKPEKDWTMAVVPKGAASVGAAPITK
jgi:zinc protease